MTFKRNVGVRSILFLGSLILLIVAGAFAPLAGSVLSENLKLTISESNDLATASISDISQVEGLINNSFSNIIETFQPSSNTSWNRIQDNSVLLDKINFADNGDSNEFVIGLNQITTSSLSLISNILTKNNAQTVNTVSADGKVIAMAVKLLPEAKSLFIQEIQASGLSKYIEPRTVFHADSLPNDPQWANQWGPQKIKADFAWNITQGNSAIIVAVIDSGIDYTHPDLAANYVPLGYDWVNNDNNPSDDFGHGTHCAGIIAAQVNNSLGIAGLAQVKIMAEKGLNQYGSGYSDQLANAIYDSVNKGAKILSNSWGSSSPSSVIHDAIIYAVNHGVLVLASAGNSGSETPNYPGAFQETVAITATDSADKPAAFTTYGDWVDAAAPGVDILSTMPTYHVTMNDNGYPMSYAYMSGTSMACPMAVGTAALIWSVFSNFNAQQVRYQLEFTGDDLGFQGFDPYYGFGRINAKNAVEQSQPVHDVLIFSWQTPQQFIKIGNPVPFSITLYNRGLSNEANVQLQLLANGNIVNSTSITSLPANTSSSVLLSWNPGIVGTYNITAYVVSVSGETITTNNIITKNFIVAVSPPDSNWTLLANDPDEGYGLSLKALSSQLYSGAVYFKVQFYRPWTTVASGIDTALFIDADQNPSTGLPDKYYPNQNDKIGADYIIIVGSEGPKMWKWEPALGYFNTSNSISFAYLDAPTNSNLFVVGVNTANFQTNGFFDCALSDIFSNWDWMPNTGYVPFVQSNDQHEIAVTLETQNVVQLGQSSMLNATVYNFGQSNETNVNLQLFINGSMVSSGLFPTLVNGSSASMSYSWNPIMEAMYNVTVYAQPAVDENAILDNARSRIVQVQYARVHNLNTGLNYLTIQQAIDATQTLNGHTIYVENGFFNQSLSISKSIKLMGQDKNHTIINGGSTGNAVTINAPNVSIGGFTIQGSKTYYDGIYVTTLASGCNITNNNIVNHSYGVYLQASNVTIQGNCITNSNSSSNSFGISLYNCIGNKITQNIVINSYIFYNPYGIYLNNASANIIEHNTLLVVGKTDIYLSCDIYFSNSSGNTVNQNSLSSTNSNTTMGIYLYGSMNNIITFNNATNLNTGFYFSYSPNNNVAGNYVTNSSNNGIYMHTSSSCLINQNNITGNYYGLYIYNSSNSKIAQNSISKSIQIGLGISYSHNCLINQNNLVANYLGLYMYNCSNNNVSQNSININTYTGLYLAFSSNSSIDKNNIFTNQWGIQLWNSTSNLFYFNNMVNNTNQVFIQYSINTWDNGYPSGGNYWSDYLGIDANHDGIGDTPYVIGTGNVDNYPLMAPWIPVLGLEKVTVWYWNSGSVVNSVASGDVDGDGQAEIVTGGYYNDGIRNVAQLCIWNGSDGAFERVTAWYWTGNTTINSVALGDVDGDGQVEIVTGGYYFDGARKVAQLLVWNGATLAAEGVKTWFWVGDTTINSIALGNVDADAQIEIVTGGTYVDSGKTIAQLAEWAGNGLALERITVWVTGGTNCTLNSVAIGNVDADGQIEIATGGHYFEGSRNVAELKIWNGATLALEQNKPWYWIANTTITSVALGDVDADGQVEVVTGGYYHDGSRNIAQLIEWAGTDLAAKRLTVWSWLSGTVLNSLAIGDIDGEGQVEIVTGGHYFDGTRNIAQVVVCSGSTLEFENIKSWYWIGSTTINAVAAGDVDGDFLKEIVTGGTYYDGTRWVSQLTVWGMK